MDAFIKKKMKQVLKGDHNAFGEIVEIYKDKVYQLCYRMLGNQYEAEDVAQEAFLRAYLNIQRYDDNRKFSTWLYRITTNLCIDRIRKRKPVCHLDAQLEGSDSLTLYSQIASSSYLPEKEVENMELQESIQQAILMLPEKYRAVIILRYIEELSLEEISGILDMPVGTVKTRLHRGREALRKHLRKL
jgi:RNA polymerase sigma-70 factor (ECF subfamily)